MRRPHLVLTVLLICVVAATFASEPTRVDGPVLGFVFDHSIGGVRPILGMPGASLFGEPVGLGIDTSRAAISNVGGYVLGVAGDSGRVMLFRDLASGASSLAIEDAAPAPDRIILSASGSAAALLYRDRNAIQVFAGLPSSPQSRGEISLFGLAGPLSAIAISDDGGSVLAGARDDQGRESVILLGPGADPRVMGSAGRVAAAAFFAGRPDAVFADSAAGTVFWVRDVRGSAEFIPLPGGGEFAKTVGLQVTADGKRVLVAGEGTVTALDLEGGAPAVSRCDCAISALDRLRGNSVFRVSDLSANPSWLFDAGGPEARFLFVPAGADASSRAISAERSLPRPTAPLPKGGAR